MLNLKKLDKIAHLALENALRLHSDAIALHENGSYPSAFYLSVLSQEEIGKVQVINDFTWNSRVNGRARNSENGWLKLLYNHRHKQCSFLTNSPLIDQWSPHGLASIRKVLKGSLELKKQRAIYVGLKKDNGKVDVEGRIENPPQISKKLAQAQITTINDYLLVTGVGVRAGVYCLDNGKIEHLVKSRLFLESRLKEWPYVGASAKSQIRAIEKEFGRTILPL